jgi:hypothetical protein
MIGEVFLANLNIHFRLVFLKAQFSVLLKPPRRDLALADAAEDWRW